MTLSRNLVLLVFLTRAANIAALLESDVTYRLFTRLDQPGWEISRNATSWGVDKDSQIVLVIHGWTENRSVEWYEDVKNAFLSRSDKIYNVIQVDWSGPASQRYSQAAEATRDVGRIIGEHIVELLGTNNASLKQIQLVGHSLGGHVAGFVGKTVAKLTGETLPWLIALDPAGPLFDIPFISDSDRLSKTDAQVVLALHTDGGRFGFFDSIGSIDVFANGGSGNQPGCPLLADAFCSHRRSHAYFIEAVRIGLFATECYNYLAYILEMCQDHKKIDIGGDLLLEQAGNYYFRTNPESPYGTEIGLSKAVDKIIIP